MTNEMTCEEIFGFGTTTFEGAKVHTFDSDSGTAYDASQCCDEISSGDLLYVPAEGVVAVLCEAWPVVAATTEPLPDDSRVAFDRLAEGASWGEAFEGKFTGAAETAGRFLAAQA